MLIDINANIGHWPFMQTNCNTCALLLERMNKYGVDMSVVSNMNGIFYKNTQPANEELYKELNSDRLFRNRFIPFAVINPSYAGWKDDLRICRSEFGMKGIRLYPLYHDYELTDPSCIELVKMARDSGLIVAFTLRMVDSRCRSWMDVTKEWSLKDVIPIINEVPDAKYFILNIANGMQLKDEEAKYFSGSDILFDTSGRNISNLADLISKFGNDKFAFGTHSPILDYLTGLLRIESLRPYEADSAVMGLLRSGNAKRVMGF
ncbi:MAG TPA: amidohydrolase [Bacteroidales bacterium]|nr:amidohydrolase [Bacteroidales bacterium]